MNSSAGILIAVLTGAIGTGYFIYGKKEGRPLPMLVGAALCIYPYFVDRLWLLALIGLVLMALPILLRD